MVSAAALAGAAAAGSAVSGAFGLRSQKNSQAWSEDFAKNQMQYRVADLKAAGLNPALAGTSQTGASAGPSTSAGQLPNPVTGALDALRTKSEIDRIDADTNLIRSKTGVLAPASEFGEKAGEFVGEVTSGFDAKKTLDEFKEAASNLSPQKLKEERVAERANNVGRSTAWGLKQWARNKKKAFEIWLEGLGKK